MSKKVLRTIGFSDITLTKEENERANGYAVLYDKDGKELASIETYLVGYETEDGDECDKDGNVL